jgi:hypothetical protein
VSGKRKALEFVTCLSDILANWVYGEESHASCPLDDILGSGKDGIRPAVKICSERKDVDFDALETCYCNEGKRLLRRSVLHSHYMGVKVSATVILDGTVWIIRDDDTWKHWIHGPVKRDAQLQEALIRDIMSQSIPYR